MTRPDSGVLPRLSDEELVAHIAEVVTLRYRDRVSRLEISDAFERSEATVEGRRAARRRKLAERLRGLEP